MIETGLKIIEKRDQAHLCRTENSLLTVEKIIPKVFVHDIYRFLNSLLGSSILKIKFERSVLLKQVRKGSKTKNKSRQNKFKNSIEIIFQVSVLDTIYID